MWRRSCPFCQCVRVSFLLSFSFLCTILNIFHLCHDDIRINKIRKFVLFVDSLNPKWWLLSLCNVYRKERACQHLFIAVLTAYKFCDLVCDDGDRFLKIDFDRSMFRKYLIFKWYFICKFSIVFLFGLPVFCLVLVCFFSLLTHTIILKNKIWTKII